MDINLSLLALSGTAPEALTQSNHPVSIFSEIHSSQEKDFTSKGISLLRATMSEWVCTIAERWCLPILEEMHKQLILLGIIHGDETVLQVLHETDRKATTDSRMWVYCNGKMNDRSIIIFEYQQTRGGIHPAKFLKGFKGFLICDG